MSPTPCFRHSWVGSSALWTLKGIWWALKMDGWICKFGLAFIVAQLIKPSSIFCNLKLCSHRPLQRKFKGPRQRFSWMPLLDFSVTNSCVYDCLQALCARRVAPERMFSAKAGRLWLIRDVVSDMATSLAFVFPHKVKPTRLSQHDGNPNPPLQRHWQ